jgi:galactose mutarotase-like enzyme
MVQEGVDAFTVTALSLREDMSQDLALSAGHTRITISPLGAELRSLETHGIQWLWHGDPAYWSGRSPALFPVIGRSPGNVIDIGGTLFPMLQHGFARTSVFETVDVTAVSARLRLTDSPETRTHYPFGFEFELAYELAENTVSIGATVRNTGGRPMPFQFGFHPAFVYPLPGVEGMIHRVLPGREEATAFHRINSDGLVETAPVYRSAAKGEVEITPGMFDAGALVAPTGVGDAMRYAAGGAAVDLELSGLPVFALWSKPSAPFLCLEPWSGMPLSASQAMRSIDHSAVVLDSGGSASFGMHIRVTPNSSNQG